MIKYLENIRLEYGSVFLSDNNVVYYDIPSAVYGSSEYFYILSPYSTGRIDGYDNFVRNTYPDFSKASKVRKVYFSYGNEHLLYEKFNLTVNDINIHCKYNYDLTFGYSNIDSYDDILIGKTSSSKKITKTITVPYGEFRTLKEYMNSKFDGKDVLIFYKSKEDDQSFDIEASRLIANVRRFERRNK